MNSIVSPMRGHPRVPRGSEVLVLHALDLMTSAFNLSLNRIMMENKIAVTNKIQKVSMIDNCSNTHPHAHCSMIDPLNICV